MGRPRVVSEFPPSYTPASSVIQPPRSGFDYRLEARYKASGSASKSKNAKVILIGNSDVGKTSVLNRFSKNKFDINYKATIGVDFVVEDYQILNTPFSLHVWDTAGQERFKSIARSYFRGAHAIMVVFDLSDPQTLTSTQRWLDDAIRENPRRSLLVFLVGNKRDKVKGASSLPPGQPALPDGLRVAGEMGAEYWEVSASTGENIERLFSRVSALLFEAQVLQEFEHRGSGTMDSAPQIGQRLSAPKASEGGGPPLKETSCCE
eukprot:Opistho-2@86152